MIWNKKKDGAENPGAETPAAQTTKAPVLFLQKNWKWLVPVVCVVIAGGVFLLKPKSASTTAVDPSYLEASPEVRDVSNTLSGTGTLNPANTYTVKSLVEGKVLTGALDSHTGREVLGMLQDLHGQGHTVVLITHDNSIAVQADRIIRLEDGQVVYDGDSRAPEAIVQPTLNFEPAEQEGNK